ncbi:MAG: potassium-transporting ATPase subunit KdpC [Anaerolineaceae bacterium]|jgi:K+-transporting ATPase ATPase C chain
MLKQLKPALIIFLSMTVLTGIIYPLAITGIAQVIFPRQANGSLITSNGQVVGSTLIGQQFDDSKYFWGRLSATGDHPYNASSSSGTNYATTNPDLLKQVEARLKALHDADPANTQPVPVDLVTASGSGLDPDISIAAAQYQAPRVARVRGIPLNNVMALIDQNTQGRQLGFLGEPTVNVLELNLALDELK